MTNSHSAIIESPEYATDVEALLTDSHIYNMYMGLPENVKEALAAGEHVEGLMSAANNEWRRRSDLTPEGLPVPKFLGSVERALRAVAAAERG